MNERNPDIYLMIDVISKKENLNNPDIYLTNIEQECRMNVLQQPGKKENFKQPTRVDK